LVLPVARALCALTAVATGLAVAGCAAREELRLLVLVTVDTLRADALGAHGNTRGDTPNLDALAAQCVVFDAAFAPTALTLPSLAGLMTGRHPALLGIRSNESALPEGAGTLAEALRDAGWRTGAVVSNYVLRAKSGMARGFERYDDALPEAEATRGWPERVAETTTAAALAAAEDCSESARQPCFLWVHYEDPHGPYAPPPELRARALPAERARPDGRLQLPLRADQRGLGGIPAYQALGGEREVAWYRAGYAGEVMRTDAAIGRLLAGLRERVGERSLGVVFAADHGEALGEGDLWFAHGERVTPELVRVPLWFCIPGLAARRRADIASLTDLGPTVARRYAGADSELARRGRDLLAPGAERGASVVRLATLRGSSRPQIGVVAEGVQLTLPEAGDARDEHWGALAPGAAENARPAAAIAERVRSELAAFAREMAQAPADRQQPLSEEDLERLRSLGYAR
jgi:arylsulfatase A-like enzyme